MRVKLGFLVAFFFTTLPVVAVRADDTHADFPRPAGLESQVRFWRQIFVEYSVHQVVLHDAVHLDKVYKVLDFRPELDGGMSPLRVERLQRAETDLELERIHNTLLRLHSLGGAVDGRRDPIFSTRAAARFLDEMHDSLGAWPLAITAYNHGPEGVARAVGQCGTRDIATIVRDYHGSAFGFASRNFYAEFLAALDVERNYREYFGNMPVEAAPRTR